jgi:hypothetical protein
MFLTRSVGPTAAQCGQRFNVSVSEPMKEVKRRARQLPSDSFQLTDSKAERV